ncbi:hypothetical protein LUZ63_017937 [Rhynchospora breviuscula]|uniref:C2H2-type domain-containing protein n=1 Tax=Rhynchospora breviuscula TaxID=2022672 RepID=A0A9Q0HGQ5_9POAL|nr:hypothetical protein LUZ63_017937 [Rhynchospora breviuscula]
MYDLKNRAHSMGASSKHKYDAQVRAANLLLSLALPPQNNKTKRRTKIRGVFECKTCNRQFPSFQALGGHMTSHLRRKVRFNRLDLVIGTKLKEPKKHVCNFCGKEFMLGQALGGHKRLHRSPAVLAEQLLHDRSEFSIDLNMPPLDEYLHI